MANPVRGEVSFEAGEAEYTLVFDFNAICSLEETFGVAAEELGEQFKGKKIKATDIRTLFRIGLARYHPMSDAEAGDIISVVGPQQAGELITKAFKRAEPEGAKNGAARPQSPARARAT